MRQRPLTVGMLLCEQVIIEERTRNVTVVNSFDHRWVDQLPERISFYVFALLTDGTGSISMKLVIEKVDDLQPVLEHSFGYNERMNSMNSNGQGMLILKARTAWTY